MLCFFSDVRIHLYAEEEGLEEVAPAAAEEVEEGQEQDQEQEDAGQDDVDAGDDGADDEDEA